MKVCGICNRTYPDSVSVCEHDGQRLQRVRRAEETAAAPTLDWEGPLVGDVFGNYRIEGLLAEGGMGRLYRAVHVGLGRAVALKFLLPEHVARPDLVQRFFNEARAVNAIRHPHIIEIHDFVETVDQDGHAQVYMVMELLEGHDTRRRLIEQGPFDPELLISVATQTAETLAAAHDAGILHRDLKPDNIFLCRHGARDDYVKVLDFGAAKGFGHRPGQHLTRPGVAIGTPEYMSPEQIGNLPMDGRVDAYGLGCVCYELLTGTLPFRGDVAAILAQHSGQRPEPLSRRRQVAPPIPLSLEEVILRCMAKRPADRYPDLWATAEAFRAAAGATALGKGEQADAPTAELDVDHHDFDDEDTGSPDIDLDDTLPPLGQGRITAPAAEEAADLATTGVHAAHAPAEEPEHIDPGPESYAATVETEHGWEPKPVHRPRRVRLSTPLLLLLFAVTGALVAGVVLLVGR